MNSENLSASRIPIVAPSTTPLKTIAWAIGLSAVALWPLLIFPYPGQQDYPNHLARGFVLLNQHDPVLQKLYSVQWTTLPNLGWDIWVVVVGQFLPLEWAGKLYVLLASVSILGGCFALSRAIGSGLTLAPLLAAPFLFNSGFTRGFLNFEMGAGCALLAAAWWVSATDKHWLRRLAIATVWSCILYLVHFYAWAFYGLFVLSYEVQRAFENRKSRPMEFLARLFRNGLQAVPALIMLFYAGASAPQPEFTVRKFEAPYVRILQIQHLIDVGDPVTSFTLTAAFACFMCLAIFRYRWLRVRRDLALPIAICVLLFFVFPDQIAGTYYVSWRILFFACLLGIAALAPSENYQRGVVPILAVVAFVTIVTSAFNAWSWRNSDVGREDFIKLTNDVPDGSALFVVHSGMKPLQLERYAVGLYHVGAFAVLTKRALVQSMFTLAGQQPLRFQDNSLQSVSKTSFTFLSEIKKEFRKVGRDLPSHLLRFDYVVVHGPDHGDDTQALSQPRLALIDQVGDFRLYKVEKLLSSNMRAFPHQTLADVEPR